MRLSSKVLFFLLIICILLSSLAFGWTSPRRLTHHLGAMEPRAVANGRNIYLVNFGTGGFDFNFLSSWNNGYSWTDPVQPSDSFFEGSEMTDIIRTPNDLIHVVWVGYYEGNSHPQIFHQSSSDGGRNWSNRHRAFFYNGNQLRYPRLAANGDTLFLAYVDVYHIRFYRSFDDGLSWQNWTTIDTAAGLNSWPTLLYSQGRLHLIYELTPDSNTGCLDIFYSKSDDAGLTWSRRVPISTVELHSPFYYSMVPSACTDEDGNILVTWYDYKYGTQCDGVMGEILARISTDNGDSWLPEGRITHTQSGTNSSCLILGNILYLAWEDFFPLGCDYSKIMISHSSDWGSSWSEPKVITGDGAVYEAAPFLLYSFAGNDSLIHCFYDVADTFSDIYYVRDKPFFVTHIPLPPDQRIYLSVKAYPNVFNSSTMLSIDNEGGGDIEIDIYNILGQGIWHHSMEGKEGSIIWDARDDNGNGVSSGTYLVRATTKDNSSTTKLLYLK